MKTAISVPEPIFREAEKLARRLKKSRSQLYAEAMAAYLRRHDANAVTEALNHVCAEAGDRVDPFVDAATRRQLTNVEW
jgi:metal-responsive CopG/Arc/MetJ family transcriptional regulator